MLTAVAAFGHDKLVVITGKTQGCGKVSIGQRPIAEQIVEIILAVLQINLDRFGVTVGFTNEAGIGPTATDVCKAPDMTENFAELIRLFPGGGECAYSSGRNPAHRAMFRIGRNVQPFECNGQKFIDKKAGVAIPSESYSNERLLRSFAPGLVAGMVPGLTKTAIVTGIAFLMNQIIEHDWDAKSTILLRIAVAVHEDHEVGRFVRRVLGRNIDAIVAASAGKILLSRKDSRCDFP